MNLQIVSAQGIIFSADVDFVVFPGTAGQLGILPRHAPLLSALSSGKIKVKQGADTKTFDFTGGFVEVLENSVTALEAEEKKAKTNGRSE